MPGTSRLGIWKYIKIDKNPCLLKLSKIPPEKKRERAKKRRLIAYVLFGLILPSTPPFNCVKYIQYNKIESYSFGS